MNIKIEKNIPLSRYTTFGIGGDAEFFCTAADSDQVKQALSWAKEKKLDVHILGGGSNLLVSDKGVRGLVIKITDMSLKYNNEDITVGAGFSTSKLVRETVGRGLMGLECFAGLPGTVGGAIYKNSHWRGHHLTDFLTQVNVMDERTERQTILKKDIKFSYDWSSFQGTNLVILNASFHLTKGDPKQLEAIADSVIKRREQNQPKGKSAGCIFKNPQGFSAGHLIDACDLKGTTNGGIIVSDLHANYLLNQSNGKAKQVMQTIKLTKNRVKEKFGVDLEPEIFFWGDMS